MAEIGLTEVSDVAREEISSQLQSFLIEEAIVLPTVTRFTAAQGMDSMKLPKVDAFVVNDKTENTAVTAQELTATSDILLLDKEKVVHFAIENRAKDQSAVNFESAGLERAAKAMALQVDKDLITQLKLVSSAGPDHSLAYANFATDNTFGRDDLIAAKILLRKQQLRFDQCVCLVSPEAEGDLLKVDDFVHVDKYGSNDAIRNGQIGKLYGLPIMVSTEIAEFETLIYHPSHVAYASQRTMQIERDRNIKTLSDEYSVHMLYGAKVLDDGIRGVLLGTA